MHFFLYHTRTHIHTYPQPSTHTYIYPSLSPCWPPPLGWKNRLTFYFPFALFQVTQQKKWAEVGRLLGYSRQQCTSMSNALKSAYNKLILPYEEWLSKHKEEASRRESSTQPSSKENGKFYFSFVLPSHVTCC